MNRNPALPRGGPESQAAADLAAIRNTRVIGWWALAVLWTWGGVSCKRSYEARPGERRVSAADPAIRYEGRWDRTDAAHPRASWPGFSVSTDFSGTRLSVLMRDQVNYYNVWIDGKLHRIIGPEKSEEVPRVLASGLTAGNHHILMRRRNISFEEPTVIAGFVVDSNARLTLPTEKPGPRIEFIGDSFTAAEGNEATADTLRWEAKYAVTNFDLGFAADIARAYDSEFAAVCRSGSGLVCDWKGNRADSMLARYDRTLMEERGPKWDFSGARPELVVICLGLNDFSGLKGGDGQVSEAGSAEFRAAYHRLIALVRGHDPRAKIVALAAFTPWLREHIGQVVREEREAGKSDVHYAQFDRFPGGYVADGHPTVETHRKMAEQVIAQLVEMKLLPPAPGRVGLERDPGLESQQRGLEKSPAHPSETQR